MDMRLDGLITGMDTRNLIAQLMEVERRPIEKKEQEIESINEKQEMWRNLQKDLKALDDSLDPLKQEENFEAMNVSSEGNVVASDAEPNAVEGDYEVVVSQIAKKHQIESQDIDDSEASLIEEGEINIQDGDVFSIEIGLGEGVESEGEYFSLEIERQDDDLMVTINGEAIVLEGEKTQSIDIEDFTLESFAWIIDENIDNVNARVSSVNENFRLVMEAEEYGREIYLEDDLDGEILTDLGVVSYDVETGEFEVLNELREYQLAIFDVNGRTFEEYEGNSVTIDGITIDISGAKPTEQEPDTSTITVSRDFDTPMESIEKFIESYNNFRDRLEEYGGEDKPLQGDSTLRMIQNRMRRAVADVVYISDDGGNSKGLVPSNMGIEFTTVIASSGYLLELDEENFMGVSLGDKIKENLEENPEELRQLFTSENGIANRLSKALELHTDEIIDNRVDGLDNRIGRLENRIDRRERRLERREENLWREFTRMEKAMSELWSMQAGMRQQLDQLTNMRRYR